jgi:protein-tyrosine phosphatase
VTEAATRHLPLDGVFNFRDLGGYRTSDGRLLAWRRLYRADGLQRLSDDGLEAFERLGIRTVLDLRTVGEIDRHGIVTPEAAEVERHHLPLLERTWSKEEVTDSPSYELVASLYLDMLGSGAERFARAFELLAVEGTYPVVFHCTAGKDRTGVLAAVLLSVLGVSDEAVVADYALSRSAVDRWLAWFRAEHPDEELPAETQAMIDASPRTMRAFLAGLRERYGSPRDYVESLPVAEGTVEALEHRLLESGGERQ